MKEELRGACNLLITLGWGSFKEEIRCVYNKGFDGKEEIVIRKTEFESDRTMGVLADKSASDIDRKLVNHMKSSTNKATVTIQTIE